MFFLVFGCSRPQKKAKKIKEIWAIGLREIPLLFREFPAFFREFPLLFGNDFEAESAQNCWTMQFAAFSLWTSLTGALVYHMYTHGGQHGFKN